MILTVTLNAAIDKRYQVEHMKKGAVNRVKKCRFSAGGKGLNVARAAVLAGEKATATGFAGGHTGELLQELAGKDGIRPEFVETKGESRTCINIMDESSGIQTELLEGGEAVTPQDIQNMKQKYKELLGKAEAVTICGSVPQGVEPDLYVEMIQEAKRAAIPVLADTSGILLKECIEARPILIKPNQDEIKQLTGKEELSREELIKAAVSLGKQGISYVVVSLGKEGSLMVTTNGVYEAKVPKIQAVNTVGCGDSMIAGFAIGIKNQWSDEKILRYASAISAANALQEKTGYFEQPDFELLYDQIEVTKIQYTKK